MSEENKLQPNKMATIQVLAGLIRNPSLLIEQNKYKFSEARRRKDSQQLYYPDFPEQFHSIMFHCIKHLAENGMTKIDYIDIDQFLKQYPAQYQVFSMNHGIEYIQKAIQISDEEKFDYYYQSLRKFTLLRELKEENIDTTEIYNPQIIDPIEFQKMQEEFDNRTISSILSLIETKTLKLKQEFESNSDIVEQQAGKGLDELLASLDKRPVEGPPMDSSILSSVLSGQRAGCLYMMSAGSGSGKTRFAIGAACRLAIPEYYDMEEDKWKRHKEEAKSVLVINTELDAEEMQTMMLSYISGVSEQKILHNECSFKEKRLRDKAKILIEKSNLFIVSISNFDTDDIINTIRRYHAAHKVEYVYFDYLSESIKLLAEGTRKTRVQLRTDQILLQMSTALKDCAKQLGIYIWTASQLSGDYKNAQELDSSYLRGAKSLGDKLDCGFILMPIRETDKNLIQIFKAKNESQQIVEWKGDPNFVFYVYKIRRGEYQNVKIYTYFDRSTCRMYDCFMTTADGDFIEILPMLKGGDEEIIEEGENDL